MRGILGCWLGCWRRWSHLRVAVFGHVCRVVDSVLKHTQYKRVACSCCLSTSAGPSSLTLQHTGLYPTSLPPHCPRLLLSAGPGCLRSAAPLRKRDRRTDGRTDGQTDSVPFRSSAYYAVSADKSGQMRRRKEQNLLVSKDKLSRQFETGRFIYRPSLSGYTHPAPVWSDTPTVYHLHNTCRHAWLHSN